MKNTETLWELTQWKEHKTWALPPCTITDVYGDLGPAF